MDQRVLLVLTTIIIQGLLAAPTSPVPSVNSATGYPYPNKEERTSDESSVINAPSYSQLLQEFELLKQNAEQFQLQILKFTSSLSAQLSPGSSLRWFISQVVHELKDETTKYLKRVEEDGNAFLSQAAKMASDKLRQGKQVVDSKLDSAQSAIEDLRRRGNHLFQTGVNYLKFIEDHLMTKLMENIQSASEKSAPVTQNADTHVNNNLVVQALNK